MDGVTHMRDEDKIAQILAGLGSGAKVTGQGMWFEVGGAGSDDFGSFQVISDTRVMFKEYDDLGNTKLAGEIEFTRENGTVAFTVREQGETEKISEGWMALVFKEESRVEIYAPWRLLGDRQAQ